MDFVVVDTDIVSFCFKNDSRAQPYIAGWTGKTLVVSFMTLAELQLWGIVRNWSQSRKSEIHSFLKQHFVVHPVNERLCGLWATLMAESRAKGRNLQTADAWIAATAAAWARRWQPTISEISRKSRA
jgi:predicted nucleic acid-binding protein